MSVIVHNMMAMNAERQFKITNGKRDKASERLSSGYRINRAGDDAAGLTISARIRDANIADEIAEFSLENILMQAGEAMITNANRNQQGILTLLQ